MFPKSNLRVRPLNGADSDIPEVFVNEAVRLGMDTVGFLGSSFPPFYKTDPHAAGYSGLRRELTLLQKRFEGKIALLWGLEYDRVPPDNGEEADYSVFTVRTLPYEGILIPLDRGIEPVRQAVHTYFGGDVYRLLRAYFSCVAQLPAGSIISGYDRIAALDPNNTLFDREDPRYLRAMQDALDELIRKDAIIQLDTAAMFRFADPSPCPMVMRRVAQMRGKVMLACDTFRRDRLLFRYADAVRYARAAGLGSIVVPRKNGFEIVSI